MCDGVVQKTRIKAFFLPFMETSLVLIDKVFEYVFWTFGGLKARWPGGSAIRWYSPD